MISITIELGELRARYMAERRRTIFQEKFGRAPDFTTHLHEKTGIAKDFSEVNRVMDCEKEYAHFTQLAITALKQLPTLQKEKKMNEQMKKTIEQECERAYDTMFSPEYRAKEGIPAFSVLNDKAREKWLDFARALLTAGVAIGTMDKELSELFLTSEDGVNPQVPNLETLFEQNNAPLSDTAILGRFGK